MTIRYHPAARYGRIGGRRGYKAAVHTRDAEGRWSPPLWKCNHWHKTRAAATRCAQAEADERAADDRDIKRRQGEP